MFRRIVLSFLALFFCGLFASAQVGAYGPIPAAGKIPWGSEISALSVDAEGRPDVLWVERAPAEAHPLPDIPNVTVTLELADGRTWVAEMLAGSRTVLDRGTISASELWWSQFKRRGEKPLLGVHAVFERHQTGVILLGLKVSNGAIDTQNPDGFPGGVFYKRLTVHVSSGRIVPEVLRFGEMQSADQQTWDLAIGDHYFPPRAQFNRRAALVPSTTDRADFARLNALARAEMELSGLVLPPVYTNYGAIKSTLPEADYRTINYLGRARYGALLAALQQGRANSGLDLQSDAMGPFDPTDWPDAGAVSGKGIEMQSGWDKTPGSTLFRRLSHDLAIERMPVALFNVLTGFPLEQLPEPVDYRLTRGRAKVTELPWVVRPASDSSWDDRRVVRDWNTGTCSYRTALLAYNAYDGAHLIRGLRNAEPSWWFARDWLARLDLEMIAADTRYSWTLHGMSASYGYVPFSLQTALKGARAAPHRGNPSLGREFGWVCHSWALDLAAAGNLTSRIEKVTHGAAALDLTATVAMPHGLTQWLQKGYFWGSPDPWITNGVPEDQVVCQWVLEGPILSNGVYGLTKNAVPATSPLARAGLDVIVRWARSAYLNPNVTPQPSSWNATVYGIPKWGFVGKASENPYQTVPQAMGEADPTDSWQHLAIAYQITKDRAFLDAMLKIGFPVTTLRARLDTLKGTDMMYTALAVSTLQGVLADQ